MDAHAQFRYRLRWGQSPQLRKVVEVAELLNLPVQQQKSLLGRRGSLSVRGPEDQVAAWIRFIARMELIEVDESTLQWAEGVGQFNLAWNRVAADVRESVLAALRERGDRARNTTIHKGEAEA